ncbi:Elongator subunit elp2, partial [Chytridiales sp. JEL 0842]
SEWICAAVGQGHTSAITTLGVARGRCIPGDHDVFATGASDGTVKIWEYDSVKGSLECVQTISVGAKYSMALSLSFLPNTSIPILISGGTDHKVSLYVKVDGKFVHTLSLQGHTDWIRSIDICTFTTTSNNESLITGFHDGDLMVATSSQDKYIRLWKIAETTTEVAATDATEAEEKDKGSSGADGFDQAIEMLQSLIGEEGDGGRQLSTKAHIIDVDVDGSKRKFTVMFDALLIGHEDWVHSVSWQPPQIIDGIYHQPLSLVSASADKSVVIWKPDPMNAIWTSEARLGEVGGTAFGFYGALFGPSGKWILAHGYNGAVQLWENQGDVEYWEARIGLSGHFASVESISWNPTGDFIVSSSLDQTTRLWGQWNREGLSTWHELARPQIHGYDIHCVTFFHQYGFVSGADEKVIRVFEAPRSFLESFQGINGLIESDAVKEQRPIGASIPALGLSNKAILPGAPADENVNVAFKQLVPNVISRPPYEQYLIQHTLWPELNKLYGHGFELISVAASHDGSLIASGSK